MKIGIAVLVTVAVVAVVVAFSAIASAEEIPIEDFEVVEAFPSQIIAGSVYEAHYRFNSTESIPVTMYFAVGGPEIGVGEWFVSATVNGVKISVLEEDAGNFTLSYNAAISTNDVIIQISSRPDVLPAAYTFTLELLSETVWVAPPSTATLTVNTTPVKGEVFVDGSWGTAPQSRSVDPGTYMVSFGDVSGYITPTPETVMLVADEMRTVTGTYIAEERPLPPPKRRGEPSRLPLIILIAAVGVLSVVLMFFVKSFRRKSVLGKASE